MKRLFGSAAVLALACVLALPVQAQTAKTMEKTAKKEDMREQMKSTGGVRGSILFQIDQAREKLIALANAMPADKYGWKPGEGVRSTGEVFNHVAAANYFLPTFWGAKVPAGVNPQTLEKEMSGDKAKTVEVLTKSFDNLREAILAVPDSDLDRKIKLFGQDATVRDAMMVLASHAHEHLGQSIAYARSNGVVPPWSK
ncbi:MAG TPA: DinB family protein [Thermoanaerobaculia bacterium]|nr:DinB family protein [Thermoanaerobaculia bacterium]